MKQVNGVGVDVDSKELMCAMRCAGQRVPLAAFANNAAGHQKFVRWATKGGLSARVCLEATGIYSLEFALALHEAKRVELMVVDPGRARICSSVHAAGQDRCDRRRGDAGLPATDGLYALATAGARNS